MIPCMDLGMKKAHRVSPCKKQLGMIGRSRKVTCQNVLKIPSSPEEKVSFVSKQSFPGVSSLLDRSNRQAYVRMFALYIRVYYHTFIIIFSTLIHFNYLLFTESLCFDISFSFMYPIDFSLSFYYFRPSGFLKMGALRAGSSAWSGWLGLLPWVSPVLVAMVSWVLCVQC